ncbi:MAG TPA: cytochrome P450, partial [Streptosporangiaceae bacterium]|nr:cytochrome P450 [Streptosporangiaceae bacterium]
MAVDDRFTEAFRETREDEPVGTRSEVVTGPVSDWATDFSHVEPEWAADPYPIQDDLRRRCPIARTERFGGAWLPTRYEDVAAIAYDTERFSSRSIILSNFRPPRELAPIGGSPPISSDPPFHHDARKLLLPAFTKAAVARQEAGTRRFCHSLIDALAGAKVVDAARDYAQHIPVRVIADLLGSPPDDGPQFREFVE